MDIIQGLIENKSGLSIVNTNGTFGVAVNTTSATLPTDIVPSGGSGVMPNAISVAGTTTGTIGTTERFISFPYSGTAATKDYSFTTTENLICDILVVGGGGGGGKRGGGGGGAGACLYHKNVILNAGTFTVGVGKGGLYGGTTGTSWTTIPASPGGDSSLIYNSTTKYRAKGGGGGQGGDSDVNSNTSGGSSGGGNWVGTADGLSSNNIFNGSVVSVLNNQYVNTLTSPEGCRGNVGGNQISIYKGGGGGGAGSAGMNHDAEITVNDGYGGLGLSIDITGASVVYAGGGNGCDYDGNQTQSFNPAYPTIQSRGGGGYGSDNGTAQNGLDGTGGGGGGQGNDSSTTLAGSGGSGIVIIRYRKPSSEIVVSSTIAGTTDRYISFPYSGTAATKDYTITTTENLICDILVVGGGGCGGRSGGGGGAVIYTQNVYFPTGGYSFKVGNGGISLKTGGIGDTQGANGSDSDILFGAITIFRAKGGGFGAANYIQSMTGGTGGSGGGSENRDNIPTFAPSVVSSANIISTNTSSSTFSTLTNQSPNGITIYGNRGGIGGSATLGANTAYSGGGGGGAGGVGGNLNASTLTSGAGGLGISINITGSAIKYGSGGASGIYNASVNATQGTSGTVDSGGGTGAYTINTTSVYGSIPTPGRGGGGGGWGVNPQNGEQLYPKDGGSGIIIIRYRKATNTVSSTLFSILSGGVIATSSNLYSNLITNYVDTPAPVSTGISSQWSSNVSKIYYNTSNVGIGTIDPVVPLHIYNTTTSRLLIDTTTTAPATLEFRRGTGADTQNDYRFINDTDTYIKLQMENSTQSYGNTSANLASFSSNETIIHKNTSINSRVGIGTVYHTTRSLDILGDANISGAVSVGRLSVGGSGSSSVNAIITNSLTSNTALTIQNSYVAPVITSSPTATTTGTTGAYTYQVFTYTSETGGAGTGQSLYTLTVSGNAVCDILIVAGGGGGGAFGGGGGAGQVLYSSNIIINNGSSIRVGNGGATTTGLNVSQDGFNSSITIGGTTYSSVGGGGGGGRNSGNFAVFVNGRNGGSGGGGNTPDGTPAAIGGLGGSSTKTSYSDWISYGNSGGYGCVGDTHLGGGGGGAGGVGGSVTLPSTSGAGGIGVNFSSLFGTSVGASGWFGGGGGGCLYGTGSGGLGGTGGGGKGGQWSPNTPNGVDGTVNTGGGGGASGLTSGYGYGTGGKGGSGIVIIRYLTPPTTISSSIEFIRGTAADANRDYKLGNYNSEFKVISSTSSVDTDYIKITTAGAITNPTGTASWNTGSDRRIKENIERASYDKCFDNINKLELNRFNYIDGFNTVSRDNKQLGFIAQEVYDIFPKAISSHEYNTDTLSIPNLLSIDVSQINYSLYGAVKKLIKINEEDEKELSSFDNRIKTIKTFLNIAMELTTSNLLDT
jgi:hypothetical protein